MEIPINLKESIEKQANRYNPNQLKERASSLSQRYRNNQGTGERMLTEEIDAVVYSIVRMPATFGAVSAALHYALQCSKFSPKTLLDVGAGTGAAVWAADAIFDLDSVICLEREAAMRKLGGLYMADGGLHAKEIEWEDYEVGKNTVQHQADLVIVSYMLNEIAEHKRPELLKSLWQATKGMLLFVEPGTPAGYHGLLKSRELLLRLGAYIAAPCPHERSCKVKDPNWCHFTCRIQRSRLHRILKEGDAPYEDEKYFYMAFTKFPVLQAKARILRHPLIEKGMITLELCGQKENKTVKIRKRDGMLFKAAKKSKCGDIFPLEIASEPK